jgi:hypothetical protein
MTVYDLCLAWNCEYDADFVGFLQLACDSRGLSLLQITPFNVETMKAELLANDLRFRSLFDRASDEDERFLPIVFWARQQGLYRINAYRLARHSWNKAAMHRAFVSTGLHTPHTIVLPACSEVPDPHPPDLSPLGTCFAIKPAHGGGGQGVINEATNWEQVRQARCQYPEDQYLLQANVVAQRLDTRQAWFRVIYCAGYTYPFWWDTQTHAYQLVTPEERREYALDPLWEIADILAGICQLHLFSSEIALTQGGQFTTVDYINDPIDLRLKSKTPQGVPDHIVEAIAHRLAAGVSDQLSSCS